MPEIASRRHLELVGPVVRAALDDGGLALRDVDRIAVTAGPGLVGALLVGVSAAKAYAYARGRPLVPVDHLHGHVASLFLAPDAGRAAAPGAAGLGRPHPAAARGAARPLRVLGRSLDDAAGEALDKGARLLGLGYPGGPAIERLGARRRPGAHRPAHADGGPRGARPQLLGAEDGAAASRAGAPGDAGGGPGRPRGRLPARRRAGARRARRGGRGRPRPAGHRRRRRRGGQRRAARVARPRPPRRTASRCTRRRWPTAATTRR